MTAFNSHNIKSFNQRCKHLNGEGKVVMTHKELRDLNSDIMDLLLYLNSLELDLANLKNKLENSEIITVELDGKSFK
jgi:predicted  nucleic acid-binding Zn-ribbon protein